MRPGVIIVACVLAFAAGPALAAESTFGGKISGERRLEGNVRVTEDVLILPGAEVVVAPGTVLTFDKSESTKVDPEFFFGGIEFVVRGTLRADGAEFRFPDRTGGIVVDGGRATFKNGTVVGAEAGITVLRGGSVAVEGTVVVRGCRVGAAQFPGGGFTFAADGVTRLEGNGVGVVRFAPAGGGADRFDAAGNEEIDRIAWNDPAPRAAVESSSPPAPAVGAFRLGDTFIDRNRTLSGDVIVDGVIRVAPGATLFLEPGSRLFFTFRDSDGDGIGENGIFLQGNLSARGTEKKPIGFHPLDDDGWGRWDSINFMASDQGENILEHVQISGAYRGVHAHFSRLSGRNVSIRRCYRGIQFQESEVELSAVTIEQALSAIRGRDSAVRLDRLIFRDTVSGANFFRSTVRLRSAALARPGWYGFRFRDSRVDAVGGTVRGGLVGVSVQEGTVGLEGYAVEEPGLAGFAIQDGDVKIGNSRVIGSRVDGISATSGNVAVAGGELSGNARFAVKLAGPAEVALRGVGSGDRGNVAFAGAGAPGGHRIHDGRSAPGLGVVRVE